MRTECQQFRTTVLEEDHNRKLTAQAQSHLQTCADCLVFYRQYKHVFDSLTGKQPIHIPERISRKTDWRVISSRKRFYPAYVLAVLIVFLVSLFVARQNIFHKLIATLPDVHLDYVFYQGEPADIYLTQSKNYVNIFISNKGD